MSEAANWVRVAAAADIPPGEMQAVEAGGQQVALFHLEDGSWHATSNVCTHAFALLTDGWLDGTTIECPLHAGRFDVCTGKAAGAPAEEDLAVYPVRIDGEAVMLGLPG
jgi:nitrite reductase/ring-hydroxylating ferredoxin subunit